MSDPELPFDCENKALRLPLFEALVKSEAKVVNASACVGSAESFAAAVNCCAMTAVIFLNSAGFVLLSCSNSLSSFAGSDTLAKSLLAPLEVVALATVDEDAAAVCLPSAACSNWNKSESDDELA